MPHNLPPLNCSGCRKCCLGDTVTLLPGDDPTQYKTKLVDGKHQLRKGSDGNCVYLGKRGCQIHARAPTMCKALDCRKYALAFDTQMTPEQRKERIANPLTAAVLREGAKRLAIGRVSG